MQNKTNSIRELGAVDVSAIKDVINRFQEGVWEKETEGRENDYECFHHTQHIICRFPGNLSDRTKVHDYPIWNILKPVLLPVLEEAVKPYGYINGAIKTVIIAKLKAGYGIDKHIDGSPSYYFLHKIHIPIETNDKVSFYIDPQNYYLEEGMAYEVNNVVSHSVQNEGDTDRVHIIFEYHNEE